jgi:antirestriction protein ArdC
VERNRTAAQRRVEKTVPGRQSVSAFGDKIRLALLADHQAQANQLGGSVRKGKHSQIVVFWKVDQIPNAESESDSEEREADDKIRRRFVLRFSRLFNLEQCELPQAVLDKLPKIETHQHDPIEAAERIIAGMPNPPEIQYAGSKAFYSPITDRITLPLRELFASTEEIYACLFHEICTVASVLVGSCGY